MHQDEVAYPIPQHIAVVNEMEQSVIVVPCDQLIYDVRNLNQTTNEPTEETTTITKK